MKKPNKYLNNNNYNNNNNNYNLNYKFDSVSFSGKVSGTALDLIRKYNDMAKEAKNCGNYVEMEIYRQYAEHYRKIVTDINERKQTKLDNQNKQRSENNPEETNTEEDTTCNNTQTQAVEATVAENGYVETIASNERPAKRFHTVEITKEEISSAETETTKPKAKLKLKTQKAKATTEETTTQNSEASEEVTTKPKRVYKRKPKVQTETSLDN